MDGEGRGGRTAALRCSEATAGGGRGIGRHQRVRASRNDSLHGEDEDDVAQLKAVFDLLLGVSSGGDAAAAGREREGRWAPFLSTSGRGTWRHGSSDGASGTRG